MLRFVCNYRRKYIDYSQSCSSRSKNFRYLYCLLKSSLSE
ncbi:hypothetical protein TFKS16_3003 [Tannerella forsythia KS16]|uniref:Uncharacterized protein n=1 Tax=Tannerella forsythia (strain ATCC 43037 / JCM 10827 / CCUG 21028 A / KCTC 5666 / FDC 338) TaxID=203275 RepID=G8UJE9_TANFA|nr:hypothetical protein BFO_3333 [Tannerella forsythia 92A2]BAR50330.1 hypothetical protein TF3313_2927 [Tannerella forsythia 3313]BAR53159.1 hypothetical protein TFKS16_3003 [Tannerella forsythia KS16]